MMHAIGAMADGLLAGGGSADHDAVQEVVTRALALGGASRFQLSPRGTAGFSVQIYDADVPELRFSLQEPLAEDEELDIAELLQRYVVDFDHGISITGRAWLDRMRKESLPTIVTALEIGDPGGWASGGGGGGAGPQETRVSPIYEYAPPPPLPPHTEALEAPPGEPPGERVSKEIGAWLDDDARPTIGEDLALHVKIGDPVDGVVPLDGDARVPVSDIPPYGLDTVWFVTSLDATFAYSAGTELFDRADGVIGDGLRFDLHVPREGDSPVVTLRLIPKRTPVTINFCIEAHGRLYRSLTATLASAESTVPAPPPAITADIVTARADRIGVVATPEPEKLTIYVLPPSTSALVSGAGDRWSFAPRPLPWCGQVNALDKKLADVRKAADGLRAAHTAYLDAIDADDLDAALDAFEPADWAASPPASDPDAEARWAAVRDSPELRKLVVYGSVLYDAVFPPGTEIRRLVDILKPGALLDIAWWESGAQVADVPWTLMYTGAPDAEIDARAFLGLRFRLKYFAYQPRGVTETFIGAPAEVDTACCLFWGGEAPLQAEARLHHAWRAGVKRVFVPAQQPSADAKDRVLALLGEETGGDRLGVLYLFCHYGKLPGQEVGFRFGDTNSDPDVISLFDLQKIQLRAIPLVVANACDTSGEDAFHAHPVKERFFSRGAGAYVGTEAKVPVAMASRFGTALMALFDGYPGGRPMALGEALAQARLLLWDRYRNLGGIYYSCVNQYDLQRR